MPVEFHRCESPGPPENSDAAVDAVQPFESGKTCQSRNSKLRMKDVDAEESEEEDGDSTQINVHGVAAQADPGTHVTTSRGIPSFKEVLDEQFFVLKEQLLDKHEKILEQALGLDPDAVSSFIAEAKGSSKQIDKNSSVVSRDSRESAGSDIEGHAGRGGHLILGVTEEHIQKGKRCERRHTGVIDLEKEQDKVRDIMHGIIPLPQTPMRSPITSARPSPQVSVMRASGQDCLLDELDDPNPAQFDRLDSILAVKERVTHNAGSHNVSDAPVHDQGRGPRKSYLSRVSKEFQDGVFEAHAVWYIDADLLFPHRTTASASVFRHHKLSVDSGGSNSQECDLNDDDFPECSELLSWCVVQPNTFKRLVWDIMCIMFNLYDVIVMPLSFFEFDNDSHQFTAGMAWITRVFWTLDIPASFFTGFVTTTGNLEMHLRAIAKAYCKSWLPLDILIVSADWIEYALDTGTSGAGAARAGRTIRALRTLRMLRLLRLVRMPHVFKRLTERFVSDNTRVVGTVINIMLCMLIISHIFACIWYGIGIESLSDRSWLNHAEPDLTKPAISIWYKYVTSLLWSLSKIASGDVVVVDPQSLGERIFTIFISTLAFTISAAAVSMITSSMTRFDLLTSKEAARFQALRQYMCDNNISAKLLARVQRNAEHALAEKRRNISENDVELLRLVSEPLRMELHFEVYSPALTWHPFFSKYAQDNPAAMQQICHSAVTVVGPYSKGDTIFTLGEVPEHPRMIFVTAGTMHYLSSAVGGVEELTVGRWICEHALWVPWKHCGTLQAASECRLLCINADSFQHLVTHFFSTAKYVDATHPSKYALEFVKRLNNSDIDQISDVTKMEDVTVDVLKAFPWNVRFNLQKDNRISKMSILHGYDKSWSLKSKFKNLLNGGRGSVLGVPASPRPKRMVQRRGTAMTHQISEGMAFKSHHEDDEISRMSAGSMETDSSFSPTGSNQGSTTPRASASPTYANTLRAGSKSGPTIRISSEYNAMASSNSATPMASPVPGSVSSILLASPSVSIIEGEN